MNELQTELTNMLFIFHKICEKYNLRYYIIAGTMLGAVRHQGFIPWDDDIDVGMPRKDYEKLHKIAKEINTEKYYIEYPGKDNANFPFLTAKMYNTQTTFTEKQRYPVKRGIYIDIFPIDGLGSDAKELKKKYERFYKNYKMYLIITGAFLKRRSLSKNMAVLLGRIISPLFISRKKLADKIDKICRQYDFDESNYVCNLLGGAGFNGVVPKEYFGMPTMIEFENIKVFGLEKPELYLKSMYGDFMKLPPEDKRVSYHDAYEIDLKKPYINS